MSSTQATKAERAHTDTVQREDDQTREPLSLSKQALALAKDGKS
jgi:hypothetical protein